MPGLEPIVKGDEKKPVATILEAAKLAGKATGLVATSEIMHATPADFSAHFPSRKNYDEEIKIIKEAKPGSMNYAVGLMISQRAHIGWTTGGHTGEDVVLYVYAPDNVERPTGVIDNTDVAKYMAEVLGVSLEEASKKLFVDAKAAFEAKGAKVEKADDGNGNFTLVVTKGSTKVEMPFNTNTVIVNGKKVELSGLIVDKTFVPQEAVNLVK